MGLVSVSAKHLTIQTIMQPDVRSLHTLCLSLNFIKDLSLLEATLGSRHVRLGAGENTHRDDGPALMQGCSLPLPLVADVAPHQQRAGAGIHN